MAIARVRVIVIVRVSKIIRMMVIVIVRVS